MAEKKYKLEILAPAREEIQEIARMHMELVGPKSARKVTNGLRKALEHLRSHPQMGRSLEDKELQRQGYRKLICGYYLCFYRVLGETIFVYHIADGRTEYKRLFHNLADSRETQQ